MLSLARWLGPWADESVVPGGVVRAEITIPPAAPGDVALRAWRVSPARGRSIGALFVVPGLHYDGPADPRFWRFMAVMARAGITVFSPFLPAFLDLEIEPSLCRDTERAWEALLAEPWLPPGARPGVMSISFGCFLAAGLAASPAHAPRVSSLLMFGGFADLRRTLRFVLTGEEPGAPGQPWDPVNQPVVFINGLDGIPQRPADGEALRDAWRAFIERTWGGPERRTPEARRAAADALASELPEAQRALFLTGCGLSEDTAAVGEASLDALAAQLAWVDPRRDLAQVRCPVTIVHGADDDVIPYTHAAELAAAVPDAVPARTLVTGLFGHTGSPGLRELLGRAPAAARELARMVRILRALARTASRGMPSVFDSRG